MARMNLKGGGAIVFDLKAINALMSSSGVQKALIAEAATLAGAAGAGYGASKGDRPHPWVARAYVETKTDAAARDNARNNTLLRVLNGKAGLVKYTSREGRESWVTPAQRDNYMRNKK